ncbi:Alpha/Beta hydrolase protein [Bisporella sp. PMI_857]|nr:Alpha/Beta hydrolase protein [Bisporella sp. PMI_857]
MSTITLQDVMHERLRLEIDGILVDLALFRRIGNSTPILFLHGWGSSKEDYVDIRLHTAFSGQPFLAYDAPGCGETWCEDLSKVNIGFLVKTAQAVLRHFQIPEYHVVGHSMGGLTALELAHSNPKAIRSFVNIKGNLTPEDCFISRQIFDRQSEDMDEFLDDFILRCRQSPFYSTALYAASIRQRVQVGAIKGIFESMVRLSDSGDLLSKFLIFSFPRTFMFGEQYASLSFLPELKAAGVELAEIPSSGHFPMYSNPVAMWFTIQDFIHRADGLQ